MSDNRNLFVKGAFVQLSTQFLGAVPNIIPFQYNPELLQRKRATWNPAQSLESDAVKAGSADSAQPFDPSETITLALEFDATDDLATPDQHPLAVASGVAARIAAIEELLFPVFPDSLNASPTATLSVSSATGTGTAPAPVRGEVPIVLFFWGPGRILPVRISDFSVDEQMFSPKLYPLRAKVSLAMQVYGPPWFAARQHANHGQLSAAESLAQGAYNYSRSQAGALARANLGNGADSILSMLPF